MRLINKIILHCSATKEGQNFDVNDIREWHKQRGYADVGYHYVILLDGTIQKGRDINKIGAHCKGNNLNSIGICYVGGLDKNNNPKDTRNKKQKEALKYLISKLLNDYKLTIYDVYCHNQFSNKSCPCFKIEDFRDEFLKYNF